jgi:hypothetical protein
VLLLIEGPSATEEMILNIAIVAGLLAAVVVGLLHLRNRRK